MLESQNALRGWPSKKKTAGWLGDAGCVVDLPWGTRKFLLAAGGSVALSWGTDHGEQDKMVPSLSALGRAADVRR